MKDSRMSSYKHVLKERHYKESIHEDKKRKDKDQNHYSKSSSHSHSRKRSRSPHETSHRKKSPLKSKTDSNNSDHHKGRKHHHESDIEELARQKRKLESELRALDLEEAAEREAENKKARRDKPHNKESKTEKKKVPDKKPKPEPHSDEDKKFVKNRNKAVTIKVEKDEYKGHTSSSSGDEKNWGKPQQESRDLKKDKEKPNFAVSGKLAEETNTYNGVVIKYNEPAEARKPKRKWRLYPFKGETDLPFIPIHRQSAYLFGRTRLIADIPIDHPSCSKQHAVLQYRIVPYKREDGTTGRRVRPYIIDLESSNGTYVNNQKVEPRCYVELVEKDVIKFGYSSREYVLLHEESKNNEDDDDVLEAND